MLLPYEQSVRKFKVTMESMHHDAHVAAVLRYKILIVGFGVNKFRSNIFFRTEKAK